MNYLEDSNAPTSKESRPRLEVILRRVIDSLTHINIRSENQSRDRTRLSKRTPRFPHRISISDSRSHEPLQEYSKPFITLPNVAVQVLIGIITR